MQHEFVSLAVSDHIATITFNHPPVNAMNVQAYNEMSEAFESVSKNPDVRCVVLRAEGKGFIGGNDIGEIDGHRRDNHAAYQAIVGRCGSAVLNCPVPVIGAVQGYAIGVGVVLALACDLVVCSTKAWFKLPEVSLGMVAGTSFVMRALPEKLVKYMCLTGRRLTAADLKAYGAVNEVVEPDELMKTVTELANEIAVQPPRTVRAFMDWYRKCDGHQTERNFDLETVYTGLLLETDERRECLKAFHEKRPASFE